MNTDTTEEIGEDRGTLAPSAINRNTCLRSNHVGRVSGRAPVRRHQHNGTGIGVGIESAPHNRGRVIVQVSGKAADSLLGTIREGFVHAAAAVLDAVFPPSRRRRRSI